MEIQDQPDQRRSIGVAIDNRVEDLSSSAGEPSCPSDDPIEGIEGRAQEKHAPGQKMVPGRRERKAHHRDGE